jgi:hypothetical protein
MDIRDAAQVALPPRMETSSRMEHFDAAYPGL